MSTEATDRTVVRSHGDTAAEYTAARTTAIMVDRADRRVLRVFGRDPVKMIHGLLTNDLLATPVHDATYGAMLTAKGRMVADMRVIRRETDLLIECDGTALDNVLNTLRKFVPPLFAKAEDASENLAVVGVYGPLAAQLVSGILDMPSDDGTAGDSSSLRRALEALDEDRALRALVNGDDAYVLRTAVTGDSGFDVVVPAAHAAELRDAVVRSGAREAGHAVLEVLRIEAGYPRWGAELTDEVIPLEAGLLERAISTSKGCYTGQEVIIRILHRGHVNRHLRGLLLGDAPTPAAGTELFASPADAVQSTASSTATPPAPKLVGRITSACYSPRYGQTIALAYVRREVEPGRTVTVGAGGANARVVELPFRENMRSES